ncbi:hypothetical protein BGZ95_001682 [Linnemannia exigua]|uniref:F-box domain-containing protein n=1 Tax=Linnemannia exigua TaxID=604196 RepID=A0AAD4H2K0_9FUNG|nr:hypothetical protein BGZ95_001682 [Linnemannia exigua]
MHLTSLTDLPPELQLIIASLLEDDCEDIYSCTLVSHDWHSIFNPILWRKVRNYWDSGESSSLVSGAASTGSLRKYGRHIQHLQLECLTKDFEEFLTLSPRRFSQLRSIELRGRVDSDEMIADLLLRCSRRHGGGVGLRRLVFDLDGCGGHGEYFGFRGKSIDALMEHVSTLEEFCVEDPWISSKEIQRLLRSTPRLQVFNILSQERKGRIDHGSWLDAKDVRLKWACTSLRVFGCPIGGIPCHDIDREISEGPVSTSVLKSSHRKSLALHRRVYSQLARLTNLQELRMGILYDTQNDNYHRYNKELDRQYDCLAMSLESGLDLLRGLKNLQIVALEDMEVGIDAEDELKWVAQHWPKAKIITTDIGTDQDTDSVLSGDEDRSSYGEFEHEDDYDDDSEDDYDSDFRKVM